MAKFTVRMVLHKASWEDYDLLAEKMSEVGFVDTIENGDGKTFKLPDAEYTGSAIDKSAALALCKSAAKAVGKEFEVLITESAGRVWFNLKPT